MMNRKIVLVALLAGIVLGVAATEGFNVYRQSRRTFQESHDSRIFQERLHCKAVADAYVKENSTDLKANPTDPNFVSVTLYKVDYSPARNSCVAELETAHVAPPAPPLVFESVQDLLSGEALFSANCTGDCVEDFLKLQWIDPAFDYAIDNASKPVALERAYALTESKIHSARQSPSGVQIDPARGETIPPKPAASGSRPWEQYQRQPQSK